MTATFSAANQNSNSPKLATLARLTTAKKVTNTSATTHWGTPGSHDCTIAEAPVISTPSTMISMNQYSHPMLNPAQRPIPMRA